MKDYFNLRFDDKNINSISNLGLAHLGDAVYELLVRSWLCSQGKCTSAGLHHAAVSYVSAPAQAEAAAKILPHLTAEEAAVYKRGRNTKVNSVPRKATIDQYHWATGLETLMGWLYLKGRNDRINELFCLIMEENANA